MVIILHINLRMEGNMFGFDLMWILIVIVLVVFVAMICR